MPAKVRYACGWPSRGGLGKKKRTIGQCWDSQCSADETFEVFVSPWLQEPADVLATLLHEMIHAAVGLKCLHGGDFRKCAKACGLIGKMTATNAGPELQTRLMEIRESIGDYPHMKLDGRKTTGPPKQTTRMLKVVCSQCEYTVRVTQKWIDVGLPVCPCGQEMELV